MRKKESRQSRDSLDWSRLPYLSSGAASVMTLSSNLLASRPQIAPTINIQGRAAFFQTSRRGRMRRRRGHSPNGLTDFDKGAGVLAEQLIPLPNANPARSSINLPTRRRGWGSGEAYFTPSWCRPYFNDRKKGWADMNSRERTEVDFNLDEEPRALPHFLFSMGCGRGRPTSTELLRVCCKRMNVMK